MNQIKIDTVNVITYCNDSVQGITSFRENTNGNKKAEKLFTALINENYPEISKEDIKKGLDNGYFEEDNWQVFIVHSS